MSTDPETVLQDQPSASQASERRPNRIVQGVLIIMFLGILVSVPLIQVAVEVRRGERPGLLEVFRSKPTAANLRAYERGLEDASVVAHRLRPWIQFAQFEWLRDGGEKALLGKNGWLFYKPGLDAMLGGLETPQTPGLTNDPLPAILAFRDALAARGMQLIVMPVPNKESVYPDMLTRRAANLRSVLAPSTHQLLAQLRAANVEVIDLFQVFAEARQNESATSAPLYLAQDSHWSPAGVDLAARVVARRLLERGWVKPGVLAYNEKPAPVPRIGDVLRMMQVPQLERRATPELVPCLQVVRPDDARPYQDDPHSEVLVLGDSFLRIYEQDEPGSAGFIAHLAGELKQPLASLVSDGGASTLVRQELYRRPALLVNKKVVLWEFVERDIKLGAEGWQLVPLPPPTTAALEGQQPLREHP